METAPIKENQSIPLASLLEKLQACPSGLTDSEAAGRLKEFGFNELAKKKKINPIAKFFGYFKDPLILILIVAASVSGATGDIRNFFIIISMVLLSVVLNFYQEHKSNQAAEKIAKKLAPKSTVWRHGKKVEILTKLIVPGDIAVLAAGDIVPADGRIIESDDLFVNEAALTGESFPAEKAASDTEADNTNVLFSGTVVVSGSAKLLITTTGAKTEYGKIAAELISPVETNAFEAGIKNFGQLIVKVIVFIVVAVFIINTLRHQPFLDSIIFSLAIAVGITPELLPMIISVNMAKGSIKMAKKGVLVKRLNAIPDFGSMDILCTDKTGTLTENKITLIKYLDVKGQAELNVLHLAFINGFFETGIKSLLDKAILDFKTISTQGLEKIDEIPYDFLRKRSSIIYAGTGRRQMVTKGAPEEIFKICTHFSENKEILKITPEKLRQFVKLYDDLSADGFRVLAIASKLMPGSRQAFDKKEESEMTMEGFLAFYDPPKKSAKETLLFMKQHGVEVKILTGDSPLVTKKICSDLDIEITGILTGDDLDLSRLSEEALAAKVRTANIIARVSPVQKEAIITALQRQGLVVGFLGDGINDAPSLKSADVGISVNNAVDVAKETADIILMQKGLQELMAGVIEGRKIFGNTMKYLMMGLSSNFGNMFSMIGAVMYLPFFPMLPGQILVNNFLYDCSQISIPLDNIDSQYLRKPKHWDIKYIRNFMLVFGPISSLFDFITFYLLFGIFHLQESAFQTGWFIESLATQTFVIYVIRTRKIPFLQSWPNKYLFLSTSLAVFIGLMLTMPWIGGFFGFTPLPAGLLLIIFGLVIVYLLLVELVKQIFYRRFNPTEKI